MRVLALLCATGCSQIFGLHDPAAVDGAVHDGAIDVPTDAPRCLGEGSLTVCLSAPPSTALVLPAQINTDDGNLCSTNAAWQGQQTASCFLVGTSITTGTSATVSVTGSRPLVLVATGMIDIRGTLDASSHVGGAIGPGADAPACAFNGVPQLNINGGGGGAGGSFTTRGGNGGAGVSNASGGLSGDSITKPSSLRGGCAGQLGVGGSGAATVGAPGDGGGAVYLLAGGSLAITGAVAVNGAGALGGANRHGGSGGGAGGMIVLHASSFLFSNAVLLANGGGGASGADSAQANDGSDPAISEASVPAPGGASGFGGPGGNGYASSIQAVAGAAAPGGANRGGGGGGGGAGYIRANMAIASGAATVSPPVDVIP